jgi:hypothetical protein
LECKEGKNHADRLREREKDKKREKKEGDRRGEGRVEGMQERERRGDRPRKRFGRHLQVCVEAERTRAEGFYCPAGRPSSAHNAWENDRNVQCEERSFTCPFVRGVLTFSLSLTFGVRLDGGVA